MVKKGWVVILVLCVGFMLGGCPKKAAIKDEPSAKAAAERALEREKAAKMEAERREREAAEAKIREEEARKRAEEEGAKKELEKGLVAKTTPGIEGTIFESSLLKDIHFDFDRYDVRPGDVEILKENAEFLVKNPNMKIQVEGHCDERGTAEYNLALGERRANSVKKYLLSLGIGETRISTISYGEEKPFDRGHDDAAWGKNRRAHFIILSK
jgi:peptidoglycan-associated lipoprotein